MFKEITKKLNKKNNNSLIATLKNESCRSTEYP